MKVIVLKVSVQSFRKFEKKKNKQILEFRRAKKLVLNIRILG